MPAIEYGSYYWCVILNGKEPGSPTESIHLHADEIAVDPTGALTFKSAGRRTAGTDPSEAEQKDNEKPGGEAKDVKAREHGSMIYFTLAPGTWKIAYAAKLQDGSPASVEHWNAPGGSPGGPVLPPNSGAAGYPARK